MPGVLAGGFAGAVVRPASKEAIPPGDLRSCAKSEVPCDGELGCAGFALVWGIDEELDDVALFDSGADPACW